MNTTTMNTMHSNDCKCFSWKPIFAGALTAVGFSFLLNLFSVAIGLTAFTTTSDGAETLALGGLIGTVLGIIVSMFAAGWITGYLSQRYCNKRHMGALYGFLAWCVALIISIFLAGYAHQYITFYTHFISGGSLEMAASTSGNAVAITASGVQTGKVVMSAYILFCLFFISAFASSLGGHCGMQHCCEQK